MEGGGGHTVHTPRKQTNNNYTFAKICELSEDKEIKADKASERRAGPAARVQLCAAVNLPLF